MAGVVVEQRVARVASRPGGDPAAFLSYVHSDDEHHGGRITAFRKRLEGELRAQTGRRDLQIFQDRDDIAWGDAWEDRVDKSVDATTFFIPVVTPAFLASEQCRRELERFLDRERRLGRPDLVLPVYWIAVSAMERPDRAGDNLAKKLAAHHYADWRSLRFQPMDSQECHQKIAELAGRMRDAFDQDDQDDQDAASAGPAIVVVPGHDASSAPAAQSPAPARVIDPPDGGDSTAMGDEAVNPTNPAARRPPPTHVVDPEGGGDFTTVAEAVAAARPGDRIIVRPGSYDGPILINKRLELVGDGPVDEIAITAAQGSVLVSTALEGSVRGLALWATGEPRDASVVDIRAGRLVLDGCDISGSATGVIVRPYADPRIRRCRIHLTSGYGIRILGNGAGEFEDNDITGNSESNIAVASKGNPTFRGNRITASQQHGVHVYDNGAGVFEDNDITGNGKSNITVESWGNPEVRSNRIAASEHEGVRVFNNGAGVFEDNDITGNSWSNIAIGSGGNPIVRGNRITASQHNGVWVSDNGAGLFEDNDIKGNSQFNIVVMSGGNPAVRGNRITAAQHDGVWVGNNGAGVFEDNDITGNGGANIGVRSDGNPTVRNNRITAAQREGVWVGDNGAGVFEDNVIAGNTLSNFTVGSGGNPTVQDNRITGSREHGVYVWGGGAGVFVRNIVARNRGQDWEVSGADSARLIRK